MTRWQTDMCKAMYERSGDIETTAPAFGALECVNASTRIRNCFAHKVVDVSPPLQHDLSEIALGRLKVDETPHEVAVRKIAESNFAQQEVLNKVEFIVITRNCMLPHRNIKPFMSDPAYPGAARLDGLSKGCTILAQTLDPCDQWLSPDAELPDTPWSLLYLAIRPA
jgi:hypothetical protein